MKLSDTAIGCIVIAAFCAPMVGVAATIWTGNTIWLLGLFALVLFL